VCLKGTMAKKDPPDYPGDEAILKAFGEAIRDIRLEKGLSLEEADALFQEAPGEPLSAFVSCVRDRGSATPGKAEHVPRAVEQRIRLARAVHQPA
jgi:hypothetical protein